MGESVPEFRFILSQWQGGRISTRPLEERAFFLEVCLIAFREGGWARWDEEARCDLAYAVRVPLEECERLAGNLLKRGILIAKPQHITAKFVLAAIESQEAEPSPDAIDMDAAMERARHAITMQSRVGAMFCPDFRRFKTEWRKVCGSASWCEVPTREAWGSAIASGAKAESIIAAVSTSARTAGNRIRGLITPNSHKWLLDWGFMDVMTPAEIHALKAENGAEDPRELDYD